MKQFYSTQRRSIKQTDASTGGSMQLKMVPPCWKNNSGVTIWLESRLHCKPTEGLQEALRGQHTPVSTGT